MLRAVLTIATVAIAVTVIGAALARAVEPETFDTFGDAIWWALETVSTVGYGDIVPESGGGRLVGSALMLLGIAFVPAVTAIVVAVLVAQLQERAGSRRGPDAELAERLERIEAALRDR